jgi:methionyl-tRNA synthetase
MKNKKYYITTSIPYTNAPPHIGFALEAIQADVLARYHRNLKEDVFYLTGTDEHGQKTVKAAKEAGIALEDFTDKTSQKFKDLKEVLNLSNDDFIRTTDGARHLPAVQKIWRKLEESGDIYKKKYKGLYCVGCEAFLPEKDLVNGKCPIHLKGPELVEEENYFFKLSKYLPEIKKIIEEDRVKIIPETRKNEVLGILKEGLEDVSFSRLKEKYWGWPVPGDDSQNLYVWPDALSNYISAVGYAKETEQFKKFWPADVHCIGKDIIKFHAIYWIAMLLSAKIDLPKSIFVHGFITSGGQKMSKSLGNVVDPFELVKKYSADAVRYYLLREIPSAEDGDFTIEKFELRYNADLAGGIGNLVARVVAMANKLENRNWKIENRNNAKINDEIERVKNVCEKSLEEFKFNEALIAIWELISWCDKYINQEKPWEQAENSKKVILDLLFAINEIADLLNPFLPQTSEKIKKVLQTRKSEILFPRLQK